MQNSPTSSSSDAGTSTITPKYQPVTVVMVAHNPGAWFSDVLASIVAQDYPALDVVVVDPGSDIPIAPRVHAVIPEATVLPLGENQGFAANVNVVLSQEALGAYLLVCHDDVALAPDCLRRLVEEALRSNAGVVGPKLLDWSDPNRILHVGLGADKTGLVSDLAEPGEYDQEQHDAVRDVFAVPGAVTLIRTDLFRTLGGFDEAMVVRGEDLDFCWRAHALGARVVVNPAATARHREGLTTRVVGTDNSRTARQHRIRALLSNYGLAHTLRVVPQAMAASFVNALIALFQGRLQRVYDIIGAWVWNLVRLPSILRRRRALARIRQVDDAEVRAMQLPGFEGLSAWRRSRADRRERELAEAGDRATELQRERARKLQATIGGWGLVLLVLLFGSRRLIAEGVPLFNEFVALPDGPSALLTEWGSTWRPSGLGSESPSSMLHALLGFGGVVLFGQLGLLRLLVTVGMVLLGALGTWRLLAPFRSIEAQLVGLLVYVALPLPYNALWEGSWSALVLYGALPWIAKRLALAAGMPPYGDTDEGWLRRLGDVGAGALFVATAALVEPVAVVVPVLLALTWTVASLATRRVRGVARLLAVSVATSVGALGLLLPSSLVLAQRDLLWSTLLGANPSTNAIELDRAMRLATGPHGDSWTGWVLLVVPALALLLASGNRFAWAVRSIVLALTSVALVGFVGAGWIDVPMPSSVVLLAPAGLGLATAAAMTAIAVSRDVSQHGFGWRQVAPLGAVAALVVTGVVGASAAFDGDWQVVDDGFTDVVAFFEETAPAHSRALWLGADEVLPVPGWEYDDELAWSLTPARVPTVLDHPIGNPGAVGELVRDVFDDSLAGGSNRLGRNLAQFGIRYVVVVESNAPQPFGTIERPVDRALTARLAEQLDLVRREVRSGATIWENRSYVPLVSRFERGELAAGNLSNIAYELALPEERSMRDYRGAVAGGDIFASFPNSTNWDLEVGGVEVAKKGRAWATAWEVDGAGEARLAHRNDQAMWWGSVVQLLVWAGLATALVLGRRRRP